MDFGTQVGPKIDKKIIKIDINISPNRKHKTFKNYCIFLYFWGLGPFKMSWKSTKNQSKVDQKSIKKLIKKMIDFFIDFLSIFGRFWLPSWSQVEAKLDQKSIKKGMQNDMQKSIVENPCRDKNGHGEMGGWVP